VGRAQGRSLARRSQRTSSKTICLDDHSSKNFTISINIKNQINNCDYYPLLFDINVFFQQKSFQYIKPQKLEIILFR
jgi:hypothetical protein